MEELSRIIDELREEMTETLKKWITIPSVKTEAQDGAPFGREVKRALLCALKDAQAMGFEVRNLDNYAGDIRMGKLGVEPLAILAHLDVVPAGDGWE
ncbi:MAG: peptidase M20, partial [Clostridia bacterium]